MNKNGKFVVLRIYLTDSETLEWMNGLICILSGEFDTSLGVFKSTDYELILHTVTEGNPSGNTPPNGFDSGILAPGKTFTHNFDTAGTIQYYCTLHPTMLGELIAK